tara:strand:+ start:383 stop:895 length:513 start_codon:yes stop_codon:yes gene_type:complete
MALANINFNLNYIEDTAYSVIKNDKDMLEKLFRGLFVVARRHLGYSPNASSFPFTTRAFSQGQLANSKHDRDDLEFYGKKGTIITPDFPQHKRQEVLTIVVTCHDDLVRDAINEINRTSDPDDAINWHTTAINVNAVMQALIEDYWTEMLTFARECQHYERNWQSYSVTK